MTTSDGAKGKKIEGPRQVFLPKARLLSQDELGALADKAKAFARECKDRGIWLELFCPGASCDVAEASELP